MPIPIKEMESIISNLKKRKSTRPSGDFYQTLKDKLIPIPYNLFQERGAEGTLSYSFYKNSITLIPKQDKDTIKKENYRPVSLLNIDV